MGFYAHWNNMSEVHRSKKVTRNLLLGLEVSQNSPPIAINDKFCVSHKSDPHAVGRQLTYNVGGFYKLPQNYWHIQWVWDMLVQGLTKGVINYADYVVSCISEAKAPVTCYKLLVTYKL